LGWFPFSRITWILESLIARGINVGNPLWHTNWTMGLLCWKFEFENTCFHLSSPQKMALVEVGWQEETYYRCFNLTWNRKDNTLSILCFLVPTIAFKTKPQNDFFLTCDTIKNIEMIKCKCNVHNSQVISTNF
jgi:hypothetical protein